MLSSFFIYLLEHFYKETLPLIYGLCGKDKGSILSLYLPSFKRVNSSAFFKGYYTLCFNCFELVDLDKFYVL